MRNSFLSMTENTKIKSARSVLIVGGGPTGVELAAEIAVDFPDKKVTIVHKGSRLLEYIGPKASRKTLKWLQSRKVDVKFEQSVDLDSFTNENRTYQTSVGESVEADTHFLCIGKPLSTAWLGETFLKDDLDGHGRIQVDEYLRVKGRNNVFAIGDITDIQVSAYQNQFNSSSFIISRIFMSTSIMQCCQIVA
jgi:apoptosis-inducing factor 2